MPTQDNSPGFLGGMWNRARGAINRRRQGISNAVPGREGFNWRQMLDVASEPFIPGDLYASQNAIGDRLPWERASNNIRGLLGPGQGAPLPGDPSMPLPNYGQPTQAPVGMGPLPNYGPNQQNAGPPAPIAQYGNGQGMFPMQPMAQPGRQGQAGRFGSTMLTGQSAINFARSFAPTGLGSRGAGGASSFGRDQLNRRGRAMG